MYSIGQLAALTGLPVKTIRFYSDAGILPPAARTENGHRRYSEAELARLQLARSLRELDVDLPSIRRVLEGHEDLAEILRAHVATVEARIRGLQRQRAVLRAAAKSPSEESVKRVQALARLDAAERRALLEHFWDRVLVASEGASPGSQVDEVAASFRLAGTPELPDEPTPEQLDAWLELAELAADEDFQQQTRENATWIWRESGRTPDAAALAEWEALMNAPDAALTLAARAAREGMAPDNARAAPVVTRFVADWAQLLRRRDGPAFRKWLLEQIEAHIDPRAARYWTLVGIIRGFPDPPPEVRERTAAYEWALEALRASVGAAGEASKASATGAVTASASA